MSDDPVTLAAEAIRDAHGRGEHCKIVFECTLCVEDAKHRGALQYKAQQKRRRLADNHFNGRHSTRNRECEACMREVK